MDGFGRVRLTNADKVLYPAAGTTKGEVFDYYVAVADAMVPHVAGRACTRKRWPNGVGEPDFFEKQLASSAPEWLDRAPVAHSAGTTVYPVIGTTEALAWIAQQASLECHVPQWRFVDGAGADGAQRTPGPATRIVFDLDPGAGVGFAQLCAVAVEVRDIIADIGLVTYPVTSGSKGLHLYVPLESPISSRGASLLAKRVALQLEQAMPDRVTATMTKSLRDGKVFVDWSQNSGKKTTVAPYSLRGREHPTVAAPRSWEELDTPDRLRQLRFDEVLDRLKCDGDLLAGLDEPVAECAGAAPHDKLATYRSMRDAARTPEPVPPVAPSPGSGDGVVGTGDRFVIQEHHARRLHYDFRLERDGVLVSWAIPKNLPESPAVNHLAVHTEDHPLEYGDFAGEIPQGEYGGGRVLIWDSGTYEAEKFRDPGVDGDTAGGGDSGRGEVIVTLHGRRIRGRYALIHTGGKNWLAHRTKEQPVPTAVDHAPMLATAGTVAALTARQWAFEGKHDGYRLLVDSDRGALRLRSRRGHDVTADFPQLRALAADLADHHVVLDGEVVALDDTGVPSFGDLQNRVRATRIEFWAFDILALDGRSLLKARYRDRRRVLETLAASATDLIVPDLLTGDGADALATARARRWEGVVAKKWDSTYQPGRRSASWLKDKHWRTQDVVIGGWRAGAGGRRGTLGALLLGVPAAGGLRFVGRVGTGFTDRARTALTETLRPLQTDASPFVEPLAQADAEGATFVSPMLVGEVRYSEWTADGRLRQPSWRGLRPDIEPDAVAQE